MTVAEKADAPTGGIGFLMSRPATPEMSLHPAYLLTVHQRQALAEPPPHDLQPQADSNNYYQVIIFR
jgi:hypothetical protein